MSGAATPRAVSAGDSLSSLCGQRYWWGGVGVAVRVLWLQGAKCASLSTHRVRADQCAFSRWPALLRPDAWRRRCATSTIPSITPSSRNGLTSISRSSIAAKRVASAASSSMTRMTGHRTRSSRSRKNASIRCAQPWRFAACCGVVALWMHTNRCLSVLLAACLCNGAPCSHQACDRRQAWCIAR